MIKARKKSIKKRVVTFQTAIEYITKSDEKSDFFI